MVQSLTSRPVAQEGTRLLSNSRLIKEFTWNTQEILPWARRIRFKYSLPITWHPILRNSTHLCLGLPSGLPVSGFWRNKHCTTKCPFRSMIQNPLPSHPSNDEPGIWRVQCEIRGFYSSVEESSLLGCYVIEQYSHRRFERAPIPSTSNWLAQTDSPSPLCNEIYRTPCVTHAVGYI